MIRIQIMITLLHEILPKLALLVATMNLLFTIIFDNDNDNDKQFIFRHVCPYNIKRDIHYL